MKTYLSIMLLTVMVAFAPMAKAENLERREYVVQPGGTKGEINFDLHSKGVDVTQLEAWNPGLGDQVKTGQVIIYYKPVQSVEKKPEVKVTPVEVPNKKPEWIKAMFYVIWLWIAMIIIGLFIRSRVKKNELRKLQLKQSEYWPSDFDQLASIIAGKTEGPEAAYCPFCCNDKNKVVSIGRHLLNDKREKKKSMCLSESQRVDLESRIKNLKQSGGTV